jgi:hypothetical protein
MFVKQVYSKYSLYEKKVVIWRNNHDEMIVKRAFDTKKLTFFLDTCGSDFVLKNWI